MPWALAWVVGSRHGIPRVHNSIPELVALRAAPCACSTITLANAHVHRWRAGIEPRGQPRWRRRHCGVRFGDRCSFIHSVDGEPVMAPVFNHTFGIKASMRWQRGPAKRTGSPWQPGEWALSTQVPQTIVMRPGTPFAHTATVRLPYHSTPSCRRPRGSPRATLHYARHSGCAPRMLPPPTTRGDAESRGARDTGLPFCAGRVYQCTSSRPPCSRP